MKASSAALGSGMLPYGASCRAGFDGLTSAGTGLFLQQPQTCGEERFGQVAVSPYAS